MTGKLYARWWNLTAVIWIFLASTTTPLRAQETLQEQIQAVVTAFVTEQTLRYDTPPRIKVGRLGPRLRLRRCSTPLAAFQPPGTRLLGNTTIGVRCDGHSPWTIYVPVQVQLFQPVAVTTRPLARGEVIRKGDFKMVKRDLGALKMGYITDSEQPVGMVVKRRIGVGTLLTPQLLEPPRLIKRGEQVTIVAKSEGLEIRASGKALMDGARGERIRVRNIRSKKVVEALVVAPGVVEVRTGSQIRQSR